MRHLEELEHTADVGLRVRARTLPGLFYWAARGLLGAMFERLPRRGGERLRVDLEAEDPETLLVRFLNELIYLAQTRGRVPVALQVHLAPGPGGCRLAAGIEAVPFDRVAERFLGEVKSATFHGLQIEKTGSGYAASVVLDV